MIFRSINLFLLKKNNNEKFIYELCVVQEWQLEVHHVSFWLVDDFLTKNG